MYHLQEKYNDAAGMKATLFALLMLLIGTVSAPGEPPPPAPAADVSAPAIIAGQVLLKDKSPIRNGIILLYDKKTGPPPHPRNYWRVPDLISGTESDGRFSITVPEGTYYLMAAQKNPENEIGPPKEKEYIYLHGDADGTPFPIMVNAGSRMDIGTKTASLWTPDMIRRSGDITAVEGVVVDLEGKPVEKAAVFGYLTKDAAGRPTFVSERTDREGRYQLRFADGGTFFLKVRSVFGGGKPQAGEFLNVTEEFVPTPVTLAKGQVKKGITLKVKKFSRAIGGEKRLQAPEMPAGSLSGMPVP